MATPVCMIILGMRLALVPIKPMFTSKVQYLAIALKLLVFPLLTLALVGILPVERNYVRGVYILACAPVGNLVLSFSELLGEGQDVAANVVLLSTLLSLMTIPVMMLLI
jgi:predicted permease